MIQYWTHVNKFDSSENIYLCITGLQRLNMKKKKKKKGSGQPEAVEQRLLSIILQRVIERRMVLYHCTFLPQILL